MCLLPLCLSIPGLDIGTKDKNHLIAERYKRKIISFCSQVDAIYSFFSLSRSLACLLVIYQIILFFSPFSHNLFYLIAVFIPLKTILFKLLLCRIVTRCSLLFAISVCRLLSFCFCIVLTVVKRNVASFVVLLRHILRMPPTTILWDMMICLCDYGSYVYELNNVVYPRFRLLSDGSRLNRTN